MLSNPLTFRRIASGTLIIVAPLLQLAAVLVDPGTWGDDREAVSFGDNPALAQAQSALYHWSWLLMAVAALGLAHLTRQRAVRLGHVAGAMTVVGYISASGLLLADPVEWWLGSHYPPEEAQRILGEMMDLPGVMYAFQLPWMFFSMIGLPLLVTAVWRAGFAGWWAPAAVAVGYLGSLFISYGPQMIPFWALPVLPLTLIGVRVLRMGDEAWAALYATAPGRTTPDSYANTTA
ncbi:hypothetical protein [Nonomuraea sp. NPDC046570]|uniref:hypothetical protein n=1 Tax=Nonomuraea sp. NPDC046570 TaxID=3155255 RepID=UPI0033C578F6